MASIQPAHGYLGIAKDYYRSAIWDTVARILKRPFGELKICILESEQGLETAYLLRHQANPATILRVNRKRGKLAIATMRLKEKGLPTTPCRAGEFAEVVQKCGPFDVINYDGCGILGTRDWIDNMRAAAVQTNPGGLFFYTRQKAREMRKPDPVRNPQTFPLWQNRGDDVIIRRVQWVEEELCTGLSDFQLVNFGEFQDHERVSTPMFWTAFRRTATQVPPYRPVLRQSASLP